MLKKILMTLCFSLFLSLAAVFNPYAGEISAASSDFGLELDESYSEVLENIFSKDELQSLISNGFNLDVIELFVLSGESKEDILERELLSTSKKYYITTRKNTKYPMLMQEYSTYSTNYLPVPSVKEVSYEEFLKSLKDHEKKSLTPFSDYDSDYSTTDFKTMEVTISKKTTDVYTVTNSVYWFDPPTNTKEDIIGIGINGNTSPVRGTEYGTQKASTPFSGKDLGSVNYSSNSSKWNRNGDYGLAVDLIDCGFLGNCAKYKINIKYDIKPNVSDLKLVDAYGHYAHQETTFSVSPSFTISKGVLGLSVSQEDKFTIHRPQPHAQVSR